MRRSTRLVVSCAGAVLLAATLLAQEPDPVLPPPPVLPPIPEELTRPMTGELRVIVRDVSFTHRGARVRVPYAEVVQEPGGPAGGVRLSLLDVRGARVSLPPDAPPARGGDSGGGPGLDVADLFVPVTDRAIDVSRVRIRDAVIEQRGAGGWRYADVDAELRDVVLGGARTERLRLVRADFEAVIEGRPVVLRRAAANATRTRGRVDVTADAELGRSSAVLTLTGVRGGALTVDGAMRTADFAELHAWLDALPRTGTGIVDGRMVLEDRRLRGELRQADLRVGVSHVSASGALGSGEVRAAVLEIHRLTSDDLEAAYGAALPGGGALAGRLTADGPLRTGVSVAGALTRVAPAAGLAANGDDEGEAPRLDTVSVRLNGVVNESAGYQVGLDITLDAGSLGDRVVSRGDSITPAGAGRTPSARLAPVRTRLDAHVDPASASWPVRGSMALHSELLLTRSGRIIPFGAAADGELELKGSRRLDVSIRPDSLPLELLPAPESVTGVHGLATGQLRVTGTLDEPQWRGWVVLADAGLGVPQAGTRLEGFGGRIEVDGYAVRTEGLSGRLGEGQLVVSGGARLDGDTPTLDARVRLERGRVLGLDSLWIVASADVQAAGPLTAPVITGEIVVDEGALLEDMTKHRTPLDLADPPYASVAARVPWLRRSRVAPAPLPPTRTGGGPRLELDVVVTEGFRVLDEDSEMYGVARVRLRGDVAALDAAGSYRITGGEYNNFGERFAVIGGIFHFSGAGFTSRVSLRAQHDHGAPLGYDLGSDGRAADYFPPLEFFALGSLSGVTEEVRRLALLRERSTELAALLLYGQPVEPVTGWQQERYWRPDGGGSVVGARARSQAVPLLWAYIADEGYDWIPLDRGYLRAGAVRVGPPFPGRLTATGLIAGGIRSDRFELDIRQPTDAAAFAGVQLRYTSGRWRLVALNEPRFRGALGFPGFAHTRRTGARIQWRTEW